MMAPAPALTPSTAAMIGCGQSAHGLDEIAGHAREVEQFGHSHFCKGPNDLVNIAAGTEITAIGTEDNQLSHPWRKRDRGRGRAVPHRTQMSAGFCALAG